jgi:hypothetical protein
MTMEKWPRTTTIYLHSDKESNWELGEELGLSNDAISDEFRSCCYEIEIEVEVHEDGTSFATHFQGLKLSKKVKV